MDTAEMETDTVNLIQRPHRRTEPIYIINNAAKRKLTKFNF